MEETIYRKQHGDVCQHRYTVGEIYEITPNVIKQGMFIIFNCVCT